MNTQEDSVFFLRYKRDQYLVDIRKQKNDQFIMAKRMKLTQGSSDNRSETSGSTRPSATSNDPIKEFKDFAQSFSNALQSEDYELIAEVAECIRRAISREGNPPLEPLANTEILVYIIRMLDPQFYEYEKLMIEGSWIIANVASGPTVFVDYLVSLDIITKAINLLEHPSAEVKENAVWILANIAGELNEYRDVLLERDIVSKIHRLVKENNLNIPLLIQLTWLIANLVGGKVPPNFELIAPLLKDLQNFLFYYDNEEIVSHTLWAFSHISNTDEQDIQHVLSLNPCEKIIGYLRSKEPHIKIPALRTVGNLLTGNDQQMDILLRHGVVEALVPLLDHSRKIIRKEACWALSNIMAGTEKQIEEVFQFRNGVIVKKLFMMIESEDAEVAKECVFCLTNATSAGTLQHITKLVGFGLIEMIVEMLKRNNEVKVLKACLEALEIVLNEFKTNVYRNNNYENNEILERIARCGGYMVIEDLQTHQDNGIYAMISRLIESHFDFD